ncbi:hypothetical protein Bbelb_227590 [Branchiostoma belcheri]|nr:hypothetical protein Bbelb_227590 [Branchiostoma belcheri]
MPDATSLNFKEDHQQKKPIHFRPQDAYVSGVLAWPGDYKGCKQRRRYRPSLMDLRCQMGSRPSLHTLSIVEAICRAQTLDALLASRGYDRFLRPSFDSDPVEVNMSMTISSIDQISEVNMHPVVDGRFGHGWLAFGYRSVVFGACLRGLKFDSVPRH